MKETIKQIIKKLPIAFTKNQVYDRQTKKVIAKVCNANSCCIDVGCHKGEVMDIMLKHAPNGIHYGFEPIPDMFTNLKEKYATTNNVHIHDYALSKETGTTSFNYVVSNPSYSGLKKRQYDKENEKDTQIEVRTELLDNILPEDYKPSLIKIDVEGGEMLVLQGAQQTIKNHKPVIVFEHGLGAADFYNSKPENLFELITNLGLKISTMEYWLANKPALTQQSFCDKFYKKQDYYFIAYP